VVAQEVGWKVIFVILAVLPIVPIPFLWFVQEPTKLGNTNTFQWKTFRTLFKWEILALALYSVVFGMTTYGSAGILSPYLEQSFGIDVLQLGFYATTLSVGLGTHP
jgi:hypothetical protein